MDKWKKEIGAGVDAESMPPCRSAGTVEPRRALIHKRRSTAAAPHKPAAHFNKRKTDSPKSGRTCCHAPLDFDAVVAQRRQEHKVVGIFPNQGSCLRQVTFKSAIHSLQASESCLTFIWSPSSPFRELLLTVPFLFIFFHSFYPIS